MAHGARRDSGGVPMDLGAVRRDPSVVVALIAAAALLAQAVIAKHVLDVRLDVISQFTGLWVFIAYQVTGLRDRAATVAFSVVIVLATAAVLALYAI